MLLPYAGIYFVPTVYTFGSLVSDNTEVDLPVFRQERASAGNGMY